MLVRACSSRGMRSPPPGWTTTAPGTGIGSARTWGCAAAFVCSGNFNQHVEVGFRFSEDAYEQMLETLAEREELFGVMLPWEHPNFGTDEYWVHTWPYEQDAEAADEVRLEVRLHNHADEMRDAWVMPRVPDSWEAVPEMLRVPCRPGAESVAVFALRVPADQAAAKVVVPVRIEFGGQDLGTFREAIVNVS